MKERRESYDDRGTESRDKTKRRRRKKVSGHTRAVG
jgi:hypothetical protein